MQTTPQEDEGIWPPPITPTWWNPTHRGSSGPDQQRLTRWPWIDRLLGLLAALFFQGGLSVVTALAVMFIHWRDDIHGDTPIPLSLCDTAMCLPLLLSLAVFAVSRQRMGAFSDGFLAGILVVSAIVMIPRS